MSDIAPPCARRWRAWFVLSLALGWPAATGCTDATRYCQSADDCTSGRCVLGRCADDTPTDAAPPDLDASAADALPTDARPIDGTRPDDDAADADGPRACDEAEPTLERCGPDRIRRVECIDGRVRRGVCAWVPAHPCGEVCRGEGCDSSDLAGVRRRVAYGVPSAIPGLTFFLPESTVSMRCSGCRWFYSANVDFACETEFDLDGAPSRTDCLYCDGGEQRTTMYAREDDALLFETRCLPSNRRLGTGRIVLRADGQVDRVELDTEGLRTVLQGQYGAGDLLEQIETLDEDGAAIRRRVMLRDEAGRIIGEYGMGPHGEYTVSYDYGCRRCDGPDCPIEAPPDCVALPGATPQAYLCSNLEPEECPDGLLPGAFADEGEAVWLSTHMLDDESPPPASRWVGARFDGDTWRWQATGEPISVPLSGGYEAERGERGYCARLAIMGDPRPASLGASGYSWRWRAHLEPIRCAALEGRSGWCRAAPGDSENRPGPD